jgi:uncharacterized membrane protein
MMFRDPVFGSARKHVGMSPLQGPPIAAYALATSSGVFTAGHWRILFFLDLLLASWFSNAVHFFGRT